MGSSRRPLLEETSPRSRCRESRPRWKIHWLRTHVAGPRMLPWLWEARGDVGPSYCFNSTWITDLKGKPKTKALQKEIIFMTVIQAKTYLRPKNHKP